MRRKLLRAIGAWCGGVLLLSALNVAAAEPAGANALGQELFTREWIAGDTRTRGGDGLGPMFNETSCVSCHNQGGVGGGGAESKNVEILSVIALSTRPADKRHAPQKSQGLIGKTLEVDAGRIAQASKSPEQVKAELKRLHPDFANSRSVVLHRFSVDPEYQSWRRRFFDEMQGADQLFGAGDKAELQRLSEASSGETAEPLTAADSQGTASEQGARDRSLGLRQAAKALQEVKVFSAVPRQVSAGSRELGGFVLSISLRNTSALYGAGLIDRIPNDALLAAAQQRYKDFPEVRGRVCKLKDGRLGRFGWKAQQATLSDFTLTACAVEIGLDVPGHPQSRTPFKPDAAEHNYDMTAEECVALTSYVADLPRPVERAPRGPQETTAIAAGKKHFVTAGCSACHAPKLGDVDGLYSDLLLHDMGPGLGDVGVYGGTAPNSSEDADAPLPLLAEQRKQREPTAEERAKAVGALRQEWRTPPLWGCRDSAPYLHDGRAGTLVEAVALHGGEARLSAIRFFALPPADRNQLLAFLKSLTAPGL